MQHSRQARRSPSTVADRVASNDTGPPIWMPAYQSGVGRCGSRNRMWSAGVMPEAKTDRNTTRIAMTSSARPR
ncbi:hypothetical protein GCM10027614_19410 [Micromonospora vulcania]